MADIDRNIVHKGSGVVKYRGVQVGVIDVVGFVFHKIGLKTESESENTCYGTVSGRLSKLDLVGEFNSLHPTPSTLELAVKNPGGEFRLLIDDVEFIDNIPSNGVLRNVEFHGVARL